MAGRFPKPLTASLVLLVLGLVLLIVSSINAPAPASPPVAGLNESVLAVPSPTWDNLPTRIPLPTPTIPTIPVSVPLQALRLALLRGDTEAAQIAWEDAVRLAPEDGVVLREGARLALASGDLETAERRAWDAIHIGPKDAEVWSILGTILARRGEPEAAGQALGVAQTLNPALAPGLFQDRWRAARRVHNSDAMSALAQDYSNEHPDDPLAFYYRASALIVSGDANSAIPQLVAVLKAEPNAPAVLWYTLGEAYLTRKAYTETFTVIEVAGARMARGDESLSLASDDPPHDLSLLLGRAYLGAGRCAEAEPIFRRLSTPDPELAPFIERAVLCQTPTPTWTPWIPSQQVTSTPTPPSGH